MDSLLLKFHSLEYFLKHMCKSQSLDPFLIGYGHSYLYFMEFKTMNSLYTYLVGLFQFIGNYVHNGILFRLNQNKTKTTLLLLWSYHFRVFGCCFFSCAKCFNFRCPQNKCVFFFTYFYDIIFYYVFSFLTLNVCASNVKNTEILCLKIGWLKCTT